MLPWRGPAGSDRVGTLYLGLETVVRAVLRLWERPSPTGTHSPVTGGHTCALLSTWENGLGLPTGGPLSVHHPHM